MNSEADYQKMTIAHLKEELSKRGIVPDAKAKKSELIKLLQKAEEDAILNHSEDSTFGDPLSTPDEDLLNDDVLNDVLPEKLIDDVSEAAKSTETEETKSTAAPASEPEKQANEAPPPAVSNDPLALDAKLKRAQRFGLPVGVTDPLAKARRAERSDLHDITTFLSQTWQNCSRFGVASAAAEKDMKAKRAERFGLSGDTAKPADSVKTSPQDEETKKKLISRAQRFGLPVNENGKALTTGFSKSEMEAKKKARLERFGMK
ncbi:hypothetical protein ANCDUO_12442 [Ancylostoma duodenale]|uniref:Uncharacterized protein n=1 Tax=Ancylostoma duodenale TaxID=51022 RepID=A0A0C2G8X2_9BILA|nr:hypothetical protein ANCDUO_12442 [Ancylostoma duodenale]